MSARVLRMYRSDKGIWRLEIERDGIIRWSSLRTRNERIARAAYERFASAAMAAQNPGDAAPESEE